MLVRYIMFWLLLGAGIAIAGSVSQGGSCSTDNNHLDPASHKFITDCDDKTFCTSSTNGTCQPKQCRRDEFPFGFEPRDVLPPMCGHGTFCPDEGSGCQSLIPVGQPCQLNRDDQCEPPSDWQTFASGQNFNGSLCLQTTCMFANATLGQRCIIDAVTYIDAGPDGEQLSNNVIRHNCQTPNFYCDTTALQCFITKQVGASCFLDQECLSMNCNPTGICQDPLDVPRKLQAWQLAVTTVAVLLSMATTVSTLAVFHKRLRLRNHRELCEYYDEQLNLRQSMFRLHQSAADSASFHVIDSKLQTEEKYI